MVCFCGAKGGGRWLDRALGSGLQMESARARVCQIHFCMQDGGLRG